MAEYDNTNRGVLFKNDRRENEKQPTHKGYMNFDGTDYYLSGWVSTTASGQTVLKLARGDVKEAKGAAPSARVSNSAPPSRPAPSRAQMLDDEVPF